MMEASRKGLIKNELESFVSCETTLYLLTAETWASRVRQIIEKEHAVTAANRARRPRPHENVSEKTQPKQPATARATLAAGAPL